MIDRIRGAEAGYPTQADELKERASELAAGARERFAAGGETIKAFVIKKPAVALGLALGLGVFLGWLIKRR